MTILISFPKHVRFLLSLIVFVMVSHTNAWADDPVPPKIRFEMGQQITETGEVILFNGWQPNIRMLIGENSIIGIGKTEADYEASVPIELREYVEKEYEIDATLILKYVGSVPIGYYDIPLPCFNIVKIEKLKVRKIIENEWKVIR